MRDYISSCHFIALVDKLIEFVDWQTHLDCQFVQDICNEDAALLGGKGNAYEEKDESISECAELIADELPEYGVEQGFMLRVEPAAHPLIKAGCTDLGKGKRLALRDALEFRINGRVNPPEGEPAGFLLRCAVVL
jgi:hypothetical protein